MNSTQIPAAANPIFMILIAALSSFKEKGFESGESTGSTLIVDFKFYFMDFRALFSNGFLVIWISLDALWFAET